MRRVSLAAVLSNECRQVTRKFPPSALSHAVAPRLATYHANHVFHVPRTSCPVDLDLGHSTSITSITYHVRSVRRGDYPFRIRVRIFSRVRPSRKPQAPMTSSSPLS